MIAAISCLESSREYGRGIIFINTAIIRMITGIKSIRRRILIIIVYCTMDVKLPEYI
jgi:hypothetical protein